MPSIFKPGSSKSSRSNMDNSAGEDAKGILEKFVGDVSKSSATKQIVLGASSGWVTGFVAMRVGKSAALALGGGILLLQVAHEKGYIKINWDKVNRNLDKVADKVTEKVTGEGSSWMDKAERYVDRKISQAENNLKKQQGKAKTWYSSFLGDDPCQLKDMHIFIVSFAAGIAIGIATA